MTLVACLPVWIKRAKNREEILRAVGRIRHLADCRLTRSSAVIAAPEPDPWSNCSEDVRAASPSPSAREALSDVRSSMGGMEVSKLSPRLVSGVARRYGRFCAPRRAV